MEVLCVFLVCALFPFSVNALYPGDECFVKEESGTCMLLSKCRRWMDEIRGSGMVPYHIRHKLLEINCGYEGVDSLICCVESSNNRFESDQNPGPFHWGNDHKIDHTNDYSDENSASSTFHTNNEYDSNKNNNNNDLYSHSSRPYKPIYTNNINNNNMHTSRPNTDWHIPTHNDNNYNTHNTHNSRPNSDDYNKPTHNENKYNDNDNKHKPNTNDYKPTHNENNDNAFTSRPNTDNNKKPSKNENNGNINDNNQSPPDISRHRNLRLLPTNCGVFEDNRIWGGNRTALYEMPWMVLMSYNSPRGFKLSCGATLISKWYLLTAAHCVTHLGSLRLVGGILGEHDIRDDPDCERNEGLLVCSPSAVNVTFAKVIPHPGYSLQNLYDDIALVKLSQPADFVYDNIKPVCLPTTQELMNEDLTGLQSVVTGWGATEDGIQSPVLLRVELPVVSNSDCQVAYNGDPKIYDRQMCAGGLQDKDSCGGDSGGPLLYPGRVGAGSIRYIQRGVVSFGSKRCGVGGLPGVYTRVAYYMDWILDNIDE